MLKTPLSFHSKDHIDDLFFTCVALQNIIHDWDKEHRLQTAWVVSADWGLGDGGGALREPPDGDFADEAGESEEARWWCRPTLTRVKAGRVKAGQFIPEATDDFSSCGTLSTTVTSWDAFKGSIEIAAPQGESARFDAKQAKLVTHFANARDEWLLS